MEFSEVETIAGLNYKNWMSEKRDNVTIKGDFEILQENFNQNEMWRERIEMQVEDYLTQCVNEKRIAREFSQ